MVTVTFLGGAAQTVTVTFSSPFFPFFHRFCPQTGANGDSHLFRPLFHLFCPQTGANGDSHLFRHLFAPFSTFFAPKPAQTVTVTFLGGAAQTVTVTFLGGAAQMVTVTFFQSPFWGEQRKW